MGKISPPCLRRLRLKPGDDAPAELFDQWRCAMGEGLKFARLDVGDRHFPGRD